jgi:hypothetical protein
VGLEFGGVVGLRHNEGTFNVLRLETGSYIFRTLVVPFELFVRDLCVTC